MANPRRVTDEQLHRIIATIVQTKADSVGPKPKLSRDEYHTLRSSLPPEFACVCDFLISAAQPGDVAAELGVTAARQATVYAQFRDETGVLPTLERWRDEAIRNARLSGAKQVGKFVAYRLRKSRVDERLLKDERRASYAARKDLLCTHPHILEVLRSVTRELGGSTKRAGTGILTPVDQQLIQRAAKGQGSNIDKLVRVANAWLQTQPDPATGKCRKISRSQLHGLLPHAQISFGSVRETYTAPRLGNHYCLSQDRMMEAISVLFSAFAVRIGADAKTVFRCNASHNAKGKKHIMLDSEHATTVSSNTGKDTQGKLNLFSMLGFHVTAQDLGHLLPGWDPAAAIAGYDVQECFKERCAFNCQLGHIQDFDKESCSRNFADVFELFHRCADNVKDAKGEICPLLFMEIDGGHGTQKPLPF